MARSGRQDGLMPSVLRTTTPRDELEAAELVDGIERAIARLQLGDAERMAYELIRFHWQRDGRRLEPGHTILDALATHNLGDALAVCEELLAYYGDQIEERVVRVGAA
jgi:hypothetical protein